MNPEFAYFLKANVAFVLFYAFYRLCFYKDTFFKMRRAILLAFFVFAFVYPLLNIQEWIKEQEPIVEIVYVYASMILPETTVTAKALHPVIDWAAIVRVSLLCLYVVLAVMLSIRFLVRLASILLLARQSRKMVVHDTEVYALPKPAGPFSFFRLIFLYPDSHSSKETEEILTHEQTHVSQWHSVDVVLSELICILCWFNPFVWLLKREVRHNLEYLADNRVIQSGYDSRNYQYHLLGLAHHHPENTGLYNSFNVMHLRNRILMMNKKRSHGFGRMKYLFIVPLVASLMILNNIGALARMNNLLPKGAGEIVQEITKTVTSVRQDTPVAVAETVAEQPKKRIALPPPPPSLQTETEIPDVVVEEDNSARIVFTVVEQQPSFPGGDTEMLNYLNRSISYPEEARVNNIMGRVICTFLVSNDGTIRDINVVRGVHESLDREAVRVIASMPKWIPGRQRGKPVTVKFTLPVTFRLDRLAETAGNTTEAEAGKIYTVVEKQPSFPGGDKQLMEYLNKSIRYPVLAQENGISGRVISTFVVNEDGSISDVEVVRGVDASLDMEAMRVISAMPKWTPGQQHQKDVRVKYTLPVTFRLQ